MPSKPSRFRNLEIAIDYPPGRFAPPVASRRHSIRNGEIGVEVDGFVEQRQCLVIGLLMLRGLLSQMDVPTRTSYVMAVVTPPERAAAASLTSVPRSLASGVSPVIAGYLMSVSQFGWPFLIGGVLKIGYDLTLLAMFRHIQPPEEREPSEPRVQRVHASSGDAAPVPRE